MHLCRRTGWASDPKWIARWVAVQRTIVRSTTKCHVNRLKRSCPANRLHMAPLPFFCSFRGILTWRLTTHECTLPTALAAFLLFFWRDLINGSTPNAHAHVRTLKRPCLVNRVKQPTTKCHVNRLKRSCLVNRLKQQCLVNRLRQSKTKCHVNRNAL